MSANPTTRPTDVALPSRREFLYYLGGLSAAVFSAGACGLLYQYVTRNVPLEQQDEVYQVNLEMLPSVYAPVAVVEARA